jgi:chemotaxis protein CheX
MPCCSGNPGADLLPGCVDHLVASTRQVFATMVNWELTSVTPIEGDALRPKSNVVGTVSFAGERSGVVAFYSTMGTAQDIAGALLGLPPDETGAEVADAIGEITNMIAGSFRTRLAADGGQWAISIPTVTVGSDFYTKYVSDVQRVLCPFRFGSEEIFVELILLKG